MIFKIKHTPSKLLVVKKKQTAKSENKLTHIYSIAATHDNGVPGGVLG